MSELVRFSARCERPNIDQPRILVKTTQIRNTLWQRWSFPVLCQ